MSNPRSILNEGHQDPLPSCFDSVEQYQEYEQLRKYTSTVRDGNFCLDCEPMYKNEMLLQMRCDHPETKFTLIRNMGEIELIGVSCRSKRWKRLSQKK